MAMWNPFRQCGTHFIKDGKSYTLNVRELCSQAKNCEITNHTITDYSHFIEFYICNNTYYMEEFYMKFTYCPACGESLTYREIGDEGLLPFCNSCSKPYFDWFGLCIITAVINEYNEVALLRQNYVSTTNWVLVAGYIKQGEALEDAVIREVAEETGQKADMVTYVSSYYYEKRELLMVGFRCDVKKSEFNQSKEVDNIEWHKLPGAVDLLREGSIAQQLLQAIIDIQKWSGN